MKKMVVFSLLVLSFPLVAFADTSDSVLDVPTASSQEQVVDSASVTNEAIAEKPVADSSKTRPSEEGTVESKKTSNEEVSAADKTMKEDPTAKTATNEFAEVEKTTDSNTVEKMLLPLHLSRRREKQQTHQQRSKKKSLMNGPLKIFVKI
ncbi:MULTISPECIES: hypothetical protein [Enterococcus]|uniref:hypothetical protein n=1 Tax=Enterococcus TaxID=1350 RepID=UPI0022E21072|nr:MULTISPECIES: hypothetical protein [Enterococcus]